MLTKSKRTERIRLKAYTCHRSMVDALCHLTSSAALGLVLSASLGSMANADRLKDDTFLLDFYIGSLRSDAAQRLGLGGYELADGTQVKLDEWYSPHFPELTFLMLTQVKQNFGIMWGFSTGEKAPKYTLSPAVHIGVLVQHELTGDGILTLSMSGAVGGRLRERPCIADYGLIGGVQKVNCRLAAGILPPEETLKNLLKIDGSSQIQVSLQYEFRF